MIIGTEFLPTIQNKWDSLHGWMDFITMAKIREIVISLNYNGDDEGIDNIGKIHHCTSIRYYLTYSWSPWNTVFMEDCNILILNLGMHYDALGQMSGP